LLVAIAPEQLAAWQARLPAAVVVGEVRAGAGELHVVQKQNA
jgi:hypothetical protein